MSQDDDFFQQAKEFFASQEAKMVASADELRKLVSSQPPLELLGFLYSQVMISQLRKSNDEDDEGEYKDVLGQIQFLLEYVHAIFASTTATPHQKLNEEEAHRILSCSEELRNASLMYAMGSSMHKKPMPPKETPGVFGSEADDIEYQTKTNWILIRGNRHQPLEEEFYQYVLAPHDDILTDVYRADSSLIAREIQEYSDTIRLGHSKAIELIQKRMEETQKLAEEKNYSQEEAVKKWQENNADSALALTAAMKDLFYGGICNVSQHTSLPSLLLSDLAYQPGEDSEFFSAGDLCGTPYRTLPARKKPLIQIDDEYYAIDPSSFRDYGHRSILWNLINRRADYKRTYESRQKEMAEWAFCDILKEYLPGATIYNEVYYKVPDTNQWAEADTIVVLDDILIVIEAKSGSLATIASPATDFERHRQALQDLILKAYSQCDRAFRYFASNPNAPIFKKEHGKYFECGKIQIDNYRVLLPIGLTVESFAPFAASCKAMPGVNPILGKHGFLSLSIDDLFVFRHILKTPGELFHYLEVRQAATLFSKVNLYDEMDHLGAYLSKNRIDMEFESQLQKDDMSMIVWDGMCDVVDNYFSGHDWKSNPLPCQEYPAEIQNLLSAIDRDKSEGWLAAESTIRNLSGETREHISKILESLRLSLPTTPNRYFVLPGSPPLYIHLQGEDSDDSALAKRKATAAAIAFRSNRLIAILARIDNKGNYTIARRFTVNLPTSQTPQNSHIFEDAKVMENRFITFDSIGKKNRKPSAPKLGRNEPCWCGSGIKFKKCHEK